MTEQPLRGKERLSLLDALRGFALLNMVLYHILYDVVYIFGHPIGWYQSAAGYVWEQFIVRLLFFLRKSSNQKGTSRIWCRVCY